jgi:DNA-binding winged helix-turn-helix (wHTH) protein/TolB-like protein/Flp pilus assembly protein TadD
MPAVQTRERYEFGRFLVDPDERLLLSDGHPVHINAKAFDTLMVLIRRPGHLVEKSELMKAVWNESFVEDGNLTVAISMIRKALGHDGDKRKYIETVARRGYRFVGDIRKVADPNLETTAEAPSYKAPAHSRRLFSLPPKFAALVLGSLVIFISVGIVNFRKQTSTQSGIRSLAVLPFVTLKSDAAHAYLGVGMADAVITKLGSTGGIIVRPTAAVAKYADSPVDLVAVGREQKVDAILTGNIQALPEQVLVTIQLVRTSDGALLWTDTLEAVPQQMASLEDRVAETVAQSMSVPLSGKAAVQLARRETANSNAYELYLEGRYFWNKRTDQSLTRSIERLQQATNEDPQFALAYAGLAESYVLLDTYGIESSQQAYPNAKAAAAKAVQLDDSLADAHSALGIVALNYEWDWRKAEQEFRRSIALNPNEADTHKWYAQDLRAMGMFDTALDEVRRAQELDPVSLNILTEVGMVYYSSRRYSDAIRVFQKVIDLDPRFVRAHVRLAMVYLAEHDLPSSIRELEEAKSLSDADPYVDGFLGYAQALSGNTRDARALLDRLTQRSRQQYVPSFCLFPIYIGLNEPDHALESLNRAYQEKSTYLVYAATDPMFDPVRSDPRFNRLLDRMGLSHMVPPIVPLRSLETGM